jgi:voltage-gated potassium channel
MGTSTGSAVPPPAKARTAAFLMRKPLSARRATRIIATFTISATVLAGILIHFTDRVEFPNIGDGLWWGVQTVTTVGYGDHVPTSTAGRIIAALVMVGGIGFLTVITATITSSFIEDVRRRVERSGEDALEAKLDQIGTRLDAIEATLGDIRGREGDASR